MRAPPPRAGGAVVMDSIAPHRDKPPACDGRSRYNGYATKQRCRAHILRESGAAARTHGKAAPELASLHYPLALLYHDAKNRRRRDPGGGPAIDTGPMEAEEEAATAIAARFGLHAAGGTSATRLANAAPFPSASAGRPGADPAHNESERMLRKVVTARRIRFGIASMGGRGRPDIPKHNDLHVDMKRNLNVSYMLLKVLSGT